MRMYRLLFLLAMPFFAARLLLPLGPKPLSSEIDNEETSRAVTRSCPGRACLAASATQTNTVTYSTSDRTGHNSRPVFCGLLPEHRWCLCSSSCEVERIRLELTFVFRL